MFVPHAQTTYSFHPGFIPYLKFIEFNKKLTCSFFIHSKYKLLHVLYPTSAHTIWKWSFPTTRHFLLPLKPTHRLKVQFDYSLKSSWAEPYSRYKAINRILCGAHIPCTKSAVVYGCIHKCLLCYHLHVCRYLC